MLTDYNSFVFTYVTFHSASTLPLRENSVNSSSENRFDLFAKLSLPMGNFVVYPCDDDERLKEINVAIEVNLYLTCIIK